MRISRFSQMFLLLMVSGWGTVWAAPEKSLDASISQQSAKITTQGTIVDAQGEPLIGVSILEVGTTNGTITDIDGKFTLQDFLFGRCGYIAILAVDESKENEFVDFMFNNNVGITLLGHVTKGEIRIDDESYGFINEIFA